MVSLTFLGFYNVPHSGGLVALGTKVKGSGEETIIKQKKQWTLTLA